MSVLCVLLMNMITLLFELCDNNECCCVCKLCVCVCGVVGNMCVFNVLMCDRCA